MAPLGLLHRIPQPVQTGCIYGQKLLFMQDLIRAIGSFGGGGTCNLINEGVMFELILQGGAHLVTSTWQHNVLF